VPGHWHLSASVSHVWNVSRRKASKNKTPNGNLLLINTGKHDKYLAIMVFVGRLYSRTTNYLLIYILFNVEIKKPKSSGTQVMVDKPCVNPVPFWNWVYYLCAQNVKQVTQFSKCKISKF